MTLGGQIINILGLSLIAPAAQYCASDIFVKDIRGLAGLCFLFLGSVFHVRFC